MVPSVSNLRTSVERAKVLRDSAVSNLSKVKKDIKRLDNEGITLFAVETFIRQLIDHEVTVGVQAVEQLQTEGLQAVFDDQDLRVRADVDVQRGKVSVELMTIQKHIGDVEVEGLSNDAFGGSVSTVQSVLLRLVIMMRWGLRPILVLDEALPAFDSNYVTNMGHFLSTLCKRLGMDILLVSHNPAMVDAADLAYRISKHNGHAKFDVIK